MITWISPFSKVTVVIVLICSASSPNPKQLVNEADDIKYELICQNGTYHQWSYTEYIGDYIRDMLREDCWNMGCYDSECDDSEEDCEVIEVNKQEFIS